MSNSVVHNGNANTFASNFASFDDASSTLSEREDFLLVLVSSLSGSMAQGRNQKRAMTIIEACGVQPEILDAADPANALVRDELCEMSGIRGVFPQFFLVQGDRTSFFADFAEIEHMNEEGTLVEWLSMELPISKLSSRNNPLNDWDEGLNTPSNENCSYSSQSHSIQDHGNISSSVIESDHEYASSSTTEDLLNVPSVSKILNSIATNDIVSNEQQQNKEQHIDKKNNEADKNKQNMILSIPAKSTAQDEWSDPLLLEQYEDEILALEGFLQEREEDEGEQNRLKKKAQNRSTQQKGETRSAELPKGKECNDINSSARINKTPNSTSFAFMNNEGSGKKEKKREKKFKEVGQHRQKDKYNSATSISSTATTVTITPTSSSSPSRSPERLRLDKNSSVKDSFSPLPTPSSFLSHKNKNNGKDSSCNIPIEATSMRSETEQLLQVEVGELRHKIEKVTTERYIVEGQLKEARQRNNNAEQYSSDRHNIGTVHKFQLQQTLRCAYCTKVFKSNPSSLNAPIASQACGHTICRNCCHKRLSAARRYRDENTMNSSERLRNTISSDLFMCGMGDMSQVYSPSFDEHQRQLQECESCPICCAPRAFRHGKLYVNESLCIVLKLLDDQRNDPRNVACIV